MSFFIQRYADVLNDYGDNPINVDLLRKADKRNNRHETYFDYRCKIIYR